MYDDPKKAEQYYLSGWMTSDQSQIKMNLLDRDRIKQTFQSQVSRAAIYYHWSKGSSGRPFN